MNISSLLFFATLRTDSYVFQRILKICMSNGQLPLKDGRSLPPNGCWARKVQQSLLFFQNSSILKLFQQNDGISPSSSFNSERDSNFRESEEVCSQIWSEQQLSSLFAIFKNKFKFRRVRTATMQNSRSCRRIAVLPGRGHFVLKDWPTEFILKTNLWSVCRLTKEELGRKTERRVKKSFLGKNQVNAW